MGHVTQNTSFRYETCPGIYMEEASLENVAAEKVSLSKIASGPCIRHRSFHRAFIEASMFHFHNVVQFFLVLLRLGFWKSFRSMPTYCNFQTFQSFYNIFSRLTERKKRMDKQYSHEADITIGLKSLNS